MAGGWWTYRDWAFYADMNLDDAVTVADVWLWFDWLYFMPGDYLIATIGPTTLGRFLELTISSYGSTGSGILSFIFWITVWGVAIGIHEGTHEVFTRVVGWFKGNKLAEINRVQLGEPGKLFIAIVALVPVLIFINSGKCNAQDEKPVAAQEDLSAEHSEALSANVRSSQQRGLADTPITHTAFSNPADEAAWLNEMSRRLAKHMPNEVERIEFLTTLHWEASRAGVDPQLLLALIQVKSGFHKYLVSPDGALGYMQVMPFWIKAIGNSDHNLFQLRTNLRYGALILRHYLDIEKGDLNRALGRYDGSLGQPEFPALVVGVWKKHWDYVPSKQPKR